LRFELVESIEAMLDVERLNLRAMPPDGNVVGLRVLCATNWEGMFVSIVPGTGCERFVLTVSR